MADFTAEVFQNQYLPADASDVHAVVAVTCSGAAAAGTGSAAAEIIIIDTSGSMENPPTKIRAARHAAQVAIDEIADGVYFAVIAGTDSAETVFPPARSELAMVRADAATRTNAKAAVTKLEPRGGTAIGRWLQLATHLFKTGPTQQCHAILLTDGRDESELRAELDASIAAAQGIFQCDCRGVGADWQVEELRAVSSALLGTVELIADPDDMEADFEQLMRAAMARGVSDATLRVWAPKGSEVLFVRQVAPTIEDLTPRRTAVSELVSEFPTGAWGDGSREYHVAVRVPLQPIGSERLAARVQLMVNDAVAAQGLVKAIWSGDDALTTQINPAVAHYTGQTELAEAIQQGLAAKADGRIDEATAKLGRAIQLAAQTGNDEATSRLRKVVDIDNAETGTVRLRSNASKLDEMALDTSSTKTTRVR
jgi:hypothetical protein